jgi:hypothetical protein
MVVDAIRSYGARRQERRFGGEMDDNNDGGDSDATQITRTE